MRIFRTILYILGILLTIMLVLGFIADKQIGLVKSIYIDTPKNLIFEEISILENMISWAPYAEGDDDVSFTFEGTSGTIGSQAKWEGNREVGKAEQEVTEIEALREVHTEIEYSKPFKSKHTYEFYLQDEGKGSRVEWRALYRIPFPFNLTNLINPRDNEFNADMEKGLKALKARCESMMKEREYKGLDIKTGYADNKSFWVNRTTTALSTKKQYVQNALNGMYLSKAIPDSCILIQPLALVHSINQRDSTVDLSVGFEVLCDGQNYEDEIIQLDSVKYYYVQPSSTNQQINDAYVALRNYIRYNGLKQESMFMETYYKIDSTEQIIVDSLLNLTYLIELNP